MWVILGGFGQSTSIPLATFFYATSTLVGAIVSDFESALPS